MRVPSAAQDASLLSGVGYIPLRGRDGSVRAWTIVDLADYAEMSAVRWCMKAGGYVVRCVGKRPNRRWERLHRRLMGLDPDDPREVDHIDRNPLNNRRSNLRVVTHAQNQQNMPGRANATSRHRGVCWDRERDRWAAWGRRDGERVFVGRFDSEDEAAEAARAWRAEHMPFATD